MTLFQLILLVVSLIFAYKFFEQVLKISQNTPKESDDEIMKRQQKSHLQMLQNRFNDLILRANDSVNEQNYENAKKSLLEAVKIRPKNEDVLMKLASILLISHEYEEAIQYFRKVININNHNDDAYKGLASSLANINEYEEASEHYKRALTINSNNEITYYNYANLLQKMEKFKEARHHYKIALNINPEFNEAKEEYEKLESKV